MLVMEKEYFESPMALELYDLLEEDAPALPQSEPSLRISRVPTPSFQGSLQLVRNVLLTIGLPYDFPIEEELMTNEEVHQSLTLRLEVGAYRVRAG